MKQTIILSLVLFTRLAAQDYFPLEVGNTWTYCLNSDTSDTRTYQVSDSINIGDMKYFLYGMVLPPQYNFIDTIRKDPVGNIWKKVNGIDYLWFDFTKDSGAVYTFPDHDPLYYYNVKIVDINFTLQTCTGNYSQCYKMSFDIPQYLDEEVFYSFAPQIGIIEIWWPEGSHNLLYSASINGSTGVVNERPSPANLFELIQNYPNPFNPITTIKYSVFTSSFVDIKIFDVLGRVIETLVSDEKKPGNYNINFNASKLPSGLYFCRMQAKNFEETKKLLLIK